MRVALVSIAVLALAACGDDPEPKKPLTIARGIFADLGQPLPSATKEQLATFERGLKVGVHRFSAAEGLGPTFNTSFCLGCHEKPVFGGSAGRYRNFLLVGQELPDGSFNETGKNGIQLQYSLTDAHEADAPQTSVRALRNPVPFFGVGLLAEIPDEEILKHADEDDRDGDGVSGKPNYDRGFVGRFGRKCQTVSIEGFIRGPIFNHLGITTDPLPDARKARLPVPSAADLGRAAGGLRAGVGQNVQGQAAAPDTPTTDDDAAPDPEMGEDELFDLVSMSMLLAAPAPDASPSPDAVEGEKLFAQARCDACHVPTLAGPRGLIPAYTDLLLHDMGEELADGIRMKLASGSEFRTQPLWGVAAVGPYLHDGRADTLDQAVRLHGGEGARARDAYLALAAADQAKVIAFLESLGGRSQHTTGLVAPGTPVPAPLEPGGPHRALDATEEQRFAAGRALFDRDQAIGHGLGPTFNGDACRSCHFDPVIGGAGPVDVDVIREGKDDGVGFTGPPGKNTILPRHRVDATRPAAWAEANVFEPRQAPPIFGLGLVDHIPDTALLALEDPDDADGDGISGRAHVLGDGRVGKLGWKAQVPSLAEFTRDALSNELGVTVPARDGFTFGNLTDSDLVADPEIDPDDVERLDFFMAVLAPLAPVSHDAAAEARGQALFSQVGCDLCHVPTLLTEDGEDVPLYSDLLLHDVAPPEFRGIQDGEASPREFRTPPLWGVSRTGPWMHHGRAFSLEEAIAGHEAEATAVRQAYEALDANERGDLLAFLGSL